MRRGKEIAQGSHASMEFLASRIRQSLSENNNSRISITLNSKEISWLNAGVAKVCLRVNSEQELLEYHHKALSAGIESHLITDSGKTEFAGKPTHTACAIGPDDSEKIDAITGELVLY